MTAAAVPAVIYAARSAQERDDDDRESTDSQITAVRRRLDREPIGIFSESGKSGSKGNRGPELQAAIEAAVSAAATAGHAELWAFHSSRFARGSGLLGEARALGKLFYDLRALGVTLRTVEDDEFVRNEQLIGIASSQSSKYAADLGAHVRRGMREAALRGDYMGRGLRLDGYAVLKDFDSAQRVIKTWIKDPDRKHIWDLIWDMARDGKSLQAIQLECSSRSFLTAPVRVDHRPRPFDTNRLAQSLDNPAYAGIVTYKGEVMPNPGNWPTYVEPEDFYRIRDERRARAHVTKRRPGRPVVGYLLAELATCGECGRRMRVETDRRERKDGTRARRYVCQSHRDPHKDSVQRCPAPPVDATQVDRLVLSGIDTLLADAQSLRGQLLAGRRAEHQRLGKVAEQGRADAIEAQRAADLAEAKYAEALTQDDDRAEVLLSVAASKRREARQATARADSALDALSTAIDEPEGEQADAVLDRVWQALSGRVQDADGDIRKLNAALREWFEGIQLCVGRDGAFSAVPVLSVAALMQVYGDPTAMPSFGVRALDNTGTAFAVDPPVLTAVRKPFLTEVKTRRATRDGSPWDSLHARKRAQVRRMAAAYLSDVSERPRTREIRFDAIGVVFDGRDRLVRLDHLEGAF